MNTACSADVHMSTKEFLDKYFEDLKKITYNVYACRERALEEAVVIKALHKELPEGQIHLNLSKLNYNFICPVHKLIILEDSQLLITQHYNIGDLMHLFDKYEPNEKIIQFYATETALAITALHKNKVLHLDVKAENFLIDYLGHVLITDFGWSKVLSGNETKINVPSKTGTNNYNSPEQIQKKRIGFTADWWSYGVMLYQAFTGNYPFEEDECISKMQIRRNILEAEPAEMEGASPAFKDLVKRLLDKNPETRLGSKGAGEVLNHQFFEMTQSRLSRFATATTMPPYLADTEKPGQLRWNDFYGSDLC